MTARMVVSLRRWTIAAGLSLQAHAHGGRRAVRVQDPFPNIYGIATIWGTYVVICDSPNFIYLTVFLAIFYDFYIISPPFCFPDWLL